MVITLTFKDSKVRYKFSGICWYFRDWERFYIKDIKKKTIRQSNNIIITDSSFFRESGYDKM
jgi:hypothetical protein